MNETNKYLNNEEFHYELRNGNFEDHKDTIVIP